MQPFENFELARYLGTWFEIARLDHSFERGLSRVTAECSLREDGGVRVVNRGYSEQGKEWNEAEGRAYFVDRADQGHLKISFYRPLLRRIHRLKKVAFREMGEHLAFGRPQFLQRRLEDDFCAQPLEGRFKDADQTRGLDVNLLGAQAGVCQFG